MRRHGWTGPRNPYQQRIVKHLEHSPGHGRFDTVFIHTPPPKSLLPARKFLYRMLIVTMYISGGMIASYIVIKSYGLLNTFWVYIIPGLISAYNVVFPYP